MVSVMLVNPFEVIGMDEALPGRITLGELFRLVAQHGRVARAEYRVPAGYVPVPDPAAGRFKDQSEEISTFAQCLLGPLALGDVVENPHRSLRATVGVQQGLNIPQQVDGGAV